MFRFKQFTVEQSQCGMKVGTDGVLLGAWCRINEPKHLLDIGTGTGLIALMAAQRTEKTLIDAIEIDPKAVQQAMENVAQSRWDNRIHVTLAALQTFIPLRCECFDDIVCNPPFFVNALKNPDTQRRQARHADTLSFAELALHAERLLTKGGALHVIFPPTEATCFVQTARSAGLFPTHITHVKTRQTATVKRQLMRFERTPSPVLSDTLIIEDSNGYTDAYKTLTHSFYLNM
ncbi:MAG: methyltransferase [Prevotellaceae bacterium]|jgi:tRNA1Val (adenine37-N6)-methyltransferase|nr:methyltransferase [Prevotellaceae bacterium]